MNRQPSWYKAEQLDASYDLAEEAFEEAKAIFTTELSKDPGKRQLVQGATSIKDLEALVTAAQTKYYASQKSGKASKWLSRLSQRVRYYGSIMDVLSQHHPEYVSLAWGLMKLTFVLLENNEKLIAALAKALSNIADSLARVKLAMILYPTMRMQQAVARLYAYIMRLHIRAHDWYKGSKLHHVWDSLARPVELRYADLLENIDSCTKEIEILASAAARAEQRDIHLELLKLTQRMESSEAVLSDVRQLIVSKNTISSSALVDTNAKLTDDQCNEVAKFVSTTSNSDFEKSVRYAALTIRQRTKKNIWSTGQLWRHPKFDHWNMKSNSAVLAIKGDYLTRFDLRNTCVGMIRLLQEQRVPVIWAIMPATDNATVIVSVADIVKDLIHQVLKLSIHSHTESSISSIYARYQRIEDDEDWFDLLASMLATLARVYIIVDLSAMGNRTLSSTEDFSWIAAFLKLASKLHERNLGTVIKVLLLGYGLPAQKLGDQPEFADVTINTKQIARVVHQTRSVPAHLRQKSGWKQGTNLRQRIR